MASFISISSGEVSNSTNSSPSPPLDSLIIVLGFGVGDPPLIKKNQKYMFKLQVLSISFDVNLFKKKSQQLSINR